MLAVTDFRGEEVGSKDAELGLLFTVDLENEDFEEPILPATSLELPEDGLLFTLNDPFDPMLHSIVNSPRGKIQTNVKVRWQLCSTFELVQVRELLMLC